MVKVVMCPSVNGREKIMGLCVSDRQSLNLLRQSCYVAEREWWRKNNEYVYKK